MFLSAALALMAGTLAQAATYDQELGIRVSVMAGQPRMIEQRILVREWERQLLSDNWVGGIEEETLARSIGAGLEASYGLYPWMKVVLAFEGRGSYAEGAFEGVGSRTLLDPVEGLLRQEAEYVSRFSEWGIDAGATFLMQDFDWSRLGISGRIGLHQLAGAEVLWEETGPYGDSWWKTDLTGYAPSVFLGLEWEMLCREGGSCHPFSVYVLLGYRYLTYRSINSVYTDSAGSRVKTKWVNDDGSHRSLEFGGPEIRLGVQMLFPVREIRLFGP